MPLKFPMTKICIISCNDGFTYSATVFVSITNIFLTHKEVPLTRESQMTRKIGTTLVTEVVTVNVWFIYFFQFKKMFNDR